MKRNTRKILLLLMLIIILLLMNNYSSAKMGKGSVAKKVTWTGDVPIEGALVEIDEEGFQQHTDFQGWVHFHNLPVGTYHLSVDIEDDGVWETIAEEFEIADNQVTQLYNSYEPLKNLAFG